jgi:hypothetical protein
MPIPTNAVLRFGPGGSFTDTFVGSADRTRLVRADLAETGDSFSEHAEGGAGGSWTGLDGGDRASLDSVRSVSSARGVEPVAVDTVSVSVAASRASAVLLAHTLLEHQAGALALLATPFASFTDRSFVRINHAESAAFVGRPARRFPFAQSIARWASAREASAYEPHAQATEDSEIDPRLARPERLFADDAGARRRTRRQQGHGLRACRSAYSQGRAAPRAEQGTLFVDR